MQRRRILKEFFYLFSPWLGLVIAILVGFYSIEHDRQKAILLHNESTLVELSRRTIEDKLVERISDLRVLADLSEQQIHDIEYLPTYLLGEMFLTFSRNAKIYDQIRILDIDGKEVVRTNYNNGNPATVPREKLQDKKGRYYFTDSMTLKLGTYFVSRIDLNIEHGKIERPLKPMIRLGVKIKDQQGQPAGVLLFNYLAENLLNEFTRSVTSISSRASIVNADGYWIKHPNPDKEWGFMHHNRERFQDFFENEWEQINAQAQGKIETLNGIFTFDTIYPILGDGTIATELESGKGLKAWKVISHLTPTVTSNANNKLIARYITISLPLVLILALVCWSLAISRLKNRLARLALLHAKKTLEIRVKKRTKALQHEINTRKLAEEKLRHMATYDGLTGIPNRELFIDRLRHGMALTLRHKAYKLALLFIDLDGFKEINDQHGHHTGDLLLKQVSHRLTHMIRESDTLGRYGGDEFVVLLQEVKHRKNAINIVNTILESMQKEFVLEDITTSISCSIGVAFFDSGMEDASSFIARADEAMYKAKKAGKSKYVLASESKDNED